MTEPPPRGGGRRRRRWLYAAIVLLGLGLIVPLVATRMLATRLSRLLGARVDINYITLQPIDAIVTLHGVVVHEPELSGKPVGPMPAIVADRVWFDVQWLPLLHRSLRLRELGLEQAHVAVDRLADGSFRLANLIQPDPTRELPAGWEFALERITVYDSLLRLRDLAAGDDAAFDMTLLDAEVSGMQRRPTAFGKALNLRIDALVGRGRVRVHGRYDLRDDGVSLDAMIRVKDVPLAQAVSSLAEGPWGDVSGRISGQLRWQREPQRRDLVTGRLMLRRGAVRVPDLEEPALSVRRVAIELEKIDLLSRRIAIASLMLRGATLALRPDANAPVPLLAGTWPRRARPPAQGTRVPVKSSGKAASPWTWIIERFDTSHARLRVLGTDGGAVDLRAHASGESLGPDAYWSPVRLEIAHGEASASFDGTARLSKGAAIEGRLSAGGIDAPGFARTVGLPWADQARSGRAAADLNVQIEPEKEGAEAVDLRGDVVLTNLELASATEPRPFTLGATGVELALEGVVPGQSAPTEKPTEIRIARTTLTGPYVRLTRAPAPPEVSGLEPSASPGAESAPTATPVPSPAASETPVAGAEAAPAPPPGPDILVRSLLLNGGKLTIDDQRPTPPLLWNVEHIAGEVRDLRLPALTFASLDLLGRDPRFGDLKLTGISAHGGNSFELTGIDVPLAATTPYLRLAGLPYYFDGGQGTIVARVSLGEDRWAADAMLTLREPRFAGSEIELEKVAGMPVANAAALLHDLNGDVALNLPLASLPPESTQTYESMIGNGIRDAIQHAMASPPQLPEGFSPLEVAFSPGLVHLTDAGEERLAALAELLRLRTGLVAVLTTDVSPKDRRWLAEQELAGDLSQRRGGFQEVLRAFGLRGSRDRIEEALAERANGEPGPLDPEDEEVLRDLLAEVPPVRTDRLVSLGESRLARARELLLSYYGIASDRVIMGRSESREGFGPPSVRIELRVEARFRAEQSSQAGIR